jgi:hypothetical protein
MRPQDARLRREKELWQVVAQRTAGSASEGSWLVLGGCRAKPPTLRLWRASMGEDATALLRLFPEHVEGQGRGVRAPATRLGRETDLGGR